METNKGRYVLKNMGLNGSVIGEYRTVSGVLVVLGVRHGCDCDLSETVVYLPDGRQLDGIDFLAEFAPEAIGLVAE